MKRYQQESLSNLQKKQKFNNFPMPKPLSSANNRNFLSNNNFNRDKKFTVGSVVSNPVRTNNQVPTVSSTKPSNQNDLWGDDDDDMDDIILHATQTAERQVISSQALDTTISSFFKDGAVTSSTQINVKTNNLNVVVQNTAKNGIPTQYQGYTEQIQNDLFADFDINSENLNGNRSQKSDPSPLAQINLPTSHGNNIPMSQAGSSQKENVDSDLKIAYYSKRVKELGSQNENLRGSCDAYRGQLQDKEGEVANLRQELRTIKQQCVKMQLEKITDNKKQNTEWIEEKRKLEGDKKTLQTENKFKDAEIARLKQSRGGTSKNETIAPKMKGSLYHISQKQQKMKIEMKINRHVFENSTNDLNNALSSCKRPLLSQLIQLQSLLSQVNSNFHQNDCVEDQDVDEFFKTCAWNITAVEYYIQNIKLPDNFHFLDKETYEIDLLADNHIRSQITSWRKPYGEASSVYQNDKLFESEQGVLLRRIISAYAIMCANSADFSKKILIELIDDKRSFIQILTECLIYINNCFKSFEYMGFVSAAAALLCGLGWHYEHYNQNQKIDKILTDFLRAILACGPDNPLAIKELAQFFFKMSTCRESFGFLRNVCSRSGIDSYVCQGHTKLVKFTNDSCILQLYATFLETTFHENKDLDEFELEHLMEVTLNTLNFFRNCFAKAKDELKFVEALDTELKQDLNWQNCNCSKKISNAIIILLHLCLKHRFANEKLLPTMCTIAKLGACVLCDIFCILKSSAAPNVNAASYKSRFHVICDCLKNAVEDGYFIIENVHAEALKLVNLKSQLIDQNKLDEEEQSQSNIKNCILKECLDSSFL